MIEYPPPDYEQTTAAIVSCGVPQANIRIVFDAFLQADVVRISDVGSDDPQRLRCLLRSVHPFYIVEIEEPVQNNAYGQLVLEEGATRARAEGEKWLRAHELFDGAPRFESGRMSLADYARAVEAHCDVEPGTALELLSDGTLTPTKAFIGSVLKNGGQQLTCIMNVLALSNQARGGVAFGFVSEVAEDDE